MHARVIHANIADLGEAKRGLDEVIPRLRETTGFLGAYFVAVDEFPRDFDRSVRDRRTGSLHGSSRRCRGTRRDGASDRVR